MKRGRSGSLGEAMEKAEVEATHTMAHECRQPADYKLFALIGRDAVKAARSMTAEQRAVFVVYAAEAIETARIRARSGGRGRLQAALNFKGKVHAESGFDDEN